MTLMRNFQAFQLASTLTLASPLLAAGCSSQPHEAERAVNAPDARVLAADPPPERSPAREQRDWLIPLAMLVMAGSANYIAWRHFKWRGTHEYLMGRAAGLTLQEDVKRIERRLAESAGDRDHWDAEFLTDLSKVSANGLLRPAAGRNDEISEALNVRHRRLPVIRTVVAESGAGKSRLAEGLVHALTHDRAGRHFRDDGYDAANRLFPDVDPANLACYRLNLGLLTHADAEPMFYYLMHRAERALKEGGRCLVIIDEAQALFEPSSHPAAARLLKLIHGWTDGQMQRNGGLWGVALMTPDAYEAHVEKHAARWRRYDRYDLPAYYGKRLESLAWEAAEDARRRRGITVPDAVLDRALELSRHSKNKTPNPHSVLNLLDDAVAGAGRGGSLTIADVNASFAKLNRLPAAEVAAWSVYAVVYEAIRKEIAERVEVFRANGPLRDAVAKQILKDWTRRPHAPVEDGADAVDDDLIDDAFRQLASVLEARPSTDKNAAAILESLRNKDKGPRRRRLAGAAPSPS